MADRPPASMSNAVRSIEERSNQGLAQRLRPVRWLLWVIPTLVASGGAAHWAIQSLLVLPDFPQCQSVSGGNATSSIWLYCAEQLASPDDASSEDLRRAITLANRVSDDDPMQAERDRLIQKWATQMLDLSEATFQAGDLEKAISMARKIPPQANLSTTVNDRIDQWRSTWEKAEELYRQAEDEIEQQRWSAAIRLASGLFNVGNTYWATTKYQELMQTLEAAKDMEAMQAKAEAEQREQTRQRANGSDPVESYLSQQRQERSTENAAILSRARSLASAGDIAGLQAAIEEARQVFYGTPQYEEAQQVIDAWEDQVEYIEDSPYLARARQLANQGDLDSIEAAIDEARQISWGRALYEEARSEIDQWNEQAYQLRVQRQAGTSEEFNSGSYPAEPTLYHSDTVPVPETVSAPADTP